MRGQNATKPPGIVQTATEWLDLTPVLIGAGIGRATGPVRSRVAGLRRSTTQPGASAAPDRLARTALAGPDLVHACSGNRGG